jgi:phosphate transport system substrate-binding protein
MPAPSPAPAADVVLVGGGSTFIRPLFDRWAEEYARRTGVRVEYRPVGSGAGVRGLVGRGFAFACTEAPLTAAELGEARGTVGEVIHVPLALGAVVPVYNLPGLAEPLRFTGPVLADIYLGKVTRWDAPAIAVNNPGVPLPSADITVIHRAEPSGTTAVWTEYLGKASGEWRERVGAGTAVRWPVGRPARGNAGVADAVGRTVGAIGYAERTAAVADNLPIGRVRNRAGRYVGASAASMAAAARSLTVVPADLRFSLTDPPGEDAYPIAGATWAVVPARPAGPLAEFLWWVTHDGQRLVADGRYAAVPAEVAAAAEAKLRPSVRP